MTTLPKTNKTQSEQIVDDPFVTISEYLEEQEDSSPDFLPLSDEPEEPEEKNDLSFNLPPLTSSEEGEPIESPAMKEFSSWDPEQPPDQTPEEFKPHSVYPYDVLNRPDQRIHQPKYGPDGKLLPGITTKDLKNRIGEDPFDTIANDLEEKEQDWLDINFYVGIAKEVNSSERAIKIAKIINGTIADTIDWPYDFTMEFMNAALTKTGMDKYVGTFKVNNFRKFFESIGLTFDEETEGYIELDEPTLYYIADFVGISIALLPLQTFIALRSATSASQMFINESAAKLAKRTWLGKQINLTTLRNKLSSKLPFLKPVPVSEYSNFSGFGRSLKMGMGEIGKTSVQHPFLVSYLETIGSAGAGVGYAVGQEYSDSPSAQLLSSVVGGVLFTSHLNLLQKTGGLVSAAIQKFGTTFGAGAQRRAANRLNSLSEGTAENNIDGVLRVILDKNAKVNLTPEQQEQYNILTKYLDKDVLELLTPAQKAAVVGQDEFLPLEKLIIQLSEDGSLSETLSAQLKELQDVMLKSFSLPAENIGYTREVFTTQQEYLQTLSAARMEVAQERAMNRIKKASPKLDEEHIAKVIREEVELALDDIFRQEDYLWAIAKMDRLVSPSAVIDIWKGLWKERSRISDPEDFLLTGQNREVLLNELGYQDQNGNWVMGALQSRPDIPEGTLVQKGQYTSDPRVSIKILQHLRRRLLKEVREQRKKGNHDKKRIMNTLQEAILVIFRQEANEIRMQKNSQTGEFEAEIDSQLGHILTAIEHSAVVNQKFNDDMVGELLGPSATAKQKVGVELTAEFIFKGTPMNQARRVRKILEAVKRESILADQKTPKNPSLTHLAGMTEDESILKPVTEAMIGYIKHQFFKKFVTEDAGKLVIKNPVAAGNWVKLRRHLLKEFPKTNNYQGLKNELMEAVIANTPGKLYGEGLPTEQIGKINKYLFNKKKQITVLFIEQDPAEIFNWNRKLTLLSKIPVKNTKKMRQVFQTLVSNAQKDPTGIALEGLQESVFEWIIHRSYLKTGQEKTFVGGSTSKKEYSEDKTFSGAKMSALLREEKTQVIIETILTEQQREKLKVVEYTANLIDSFRVSTPLLDKSGQYQSISGDKVGWFLHKVGKVLGALAGRKLRTGTLQGPTEGARIGELIAEKMKIDWAERYLIHAFMSSDSKDLAVLLQKIDTPAKAQEFNRHLRSFFAYTISEYNLPFPNIDRFGTIDGEEEEEPTEIP